ncbi:MAG: DUF368 domain-containing protein [Clostridia bacterium]|nr:DUF368 domain-containing protein [Clostridia bacterium]
MRINSRSGLKLMKNTVFGVIIGASMLVPGLSGGTTAIILGIYDRLISAVSGIFTNFRKNMIFLGSVAIGGATGVFLFSGAVLKLTELFPVQTMYFFIGAILGGIPLLLKKSGITPKRLYNMIFALLGCAAAAAVSALPVGTNESGGALMLILSGMVIAVAMVLPGISTSHILLVLGMYESVWGAVRELRLGYLSLLAAGGAAGTILTAKLTDICMKKFPCQTYMIIIGFVMTSVYDIFPSGVSTSQIPVCILLCTAGFASVVILSSFGDKAVDDPSASEN